MYVKYINDNEFITYFFFVVKENIRSKLRDICMIKINAFFLMFQNYKLSSFPIFSNSTMFYLYPLLFV